MVSKLPPLWLAVVLMMFPQIVETIYSPALTDIAMQFKVSDAQASQTLSVYFLAFAVGVVFWGRLCDLIGRRPAMLAGLFTYGVGAFIALVTTNFEVLMLARVVSAFGAAVGSVITQTMLRDTYEGPDLAKVFSVMGVALSISPVLGLISGGLLAENFGYAGVFSGLMVLALVLMLIAMWRLPETRPETTVKVALFPLIKRMVKDSSLWFSAALVALFNTMLFGYYSLAPFLFSDLGLTTSQFGYSGVILAAATFIGSMMNKKLLTKGWTPNALIRIAVGIALTCGLLVWLNQSSLWFLLPMMGIVISFGIAIPNILSQALIAYKEVAGSAGALFGLSYYLLLSLGLGIAGLLQSLGLILTLCSILAVISTFMLTVKK
ncbi:multidrug effflux MFS transporter [Vibrio cholerae]|uniref:multidrug effflux MFS transporter n=1 Tax=Vibrio cholerae TaxID=666 RepID=UPI0011596DC6|nr:multidrug effflux MFS transporter [Vibrio cholerae]MCD1216698.1 MFS transporter [Vibrio cholerae]MCD1234837.1 MFS transporter [Vibrio cholerae]MCD1241986.1 MFS transporter [Vibrio cholerae]MCD1257057.1 MFS transporter [Vibrio cholerae]TQQ78345.1 multidrug effflux MFS transporter [Vibrio cholerae]